MRIVTNKKLARRNRKMTNYLFFGTFGALILGFVVINASLFTNQAPDMLTLIAQSGCLAGGICADHHLGAHDQPVGRGCPGPESAIADGLKGMSNKSVLYNYHHFPARHVLICPPGRLRNRDALA